MALDSSLFWRQKCYPKPRFRVSLGSFIKPSRERVAFAPSRNSSCLGSIRKRVGLELTINRRLQIIFYSRGKCVKLASPLPRDFEFSTQEENIFSSANDEYWPERHLSRSIAADNLPPGRYATDSDPLTAKRASRPPAIPSDALVLLPGVIGPWA